MPETLKERDWDILLRRINDGKCTPFLGAGACYGVLPLGSEIAAKWATKYEFPFDDIKGLASIAQFLAVEREDPMFPKEEIAKLLKNGAIPDFTEHDEPHRVLADLPISTYITTNYDNFMEMALQRRNKDPKLEICRWNKYIKNQLSILESKPSFDPSPERPVIFHLHGYWGIPESLVLSEDDYIDFLVNISRDRALLPLQIERAIIGSSLLFIGYGLADWNFRVIFRGLISSIEQSLRRINVAVLVPPYGSETKHQKAQEYLTKYFESTDVRVYWGTAREFVTELRQRYEVFSAKP